MKRIASSEQGKSEALLLLHFIIYLWFLTVETSTTYRYQYAQYNTRKSYLYVLYFSCIF